MHIGSESLAYLKNFKMHILYAYFPLFIQHLKPKNTKINQELSVPMLEY